MPQVKWSKDIVKINVTWNNLSLSRNGKENCVRLKLLVVLPDDGLNLLRDVFQSRSEEGSYFMHFVVK